MEIIKIDFINTIWLNPDDNKFVSVIKGTKYHIEKEEADGYEKRVNIYLTNEEFSEFVNKLSSETKFENWNNEYIDPNVLDGMTCRISIFYSDGNKKNIICTNKYPEKFEKFFKIIDEIENPK